MLTLKTLRNLELRYPFKIHVRPINQVGYDIKELNIKELGTLGDFLDHFEDKQSNLEMYKNVYNLNGPVILLLESHSAQVCALHLPH